MLTLGTPALMKAYTARISGSHDYTLAVDILNTEEKALAPATLIDGQINFQRDSDVRRTATLTLLDPDHSLNLDPDSVYAGALFLDRLVRVRHMIEVPGYGTVSATVFVGPLSKLSRDGATINVEAQDKAAFAALGCPPMHVAKGTNAVAAIKSFMSKRAGERHFRFPSGTKTRLSHHRAVGWADETSCWAVCQSIAGHIGMQLFYSADGFCTLRPKPNKPLFEFGPDLLTSGLPTGDNDFSSGVNYARVKAGTIVKSAVAPAPLSPARLGRNGVGRYFPALGDVDAPTKPSSHKPGRKATHKQKHAYNAAMAKYAGEKKTASAQAHAEALSLIASARVTTEIAATAVPVFHLDVDDPVRLKTDQGQLTLPFSSGSIPLVTGDMSIGLIRRVSRPRR